MLIGWKTFDKMRGNYGLLLIMVLVVIGLSPFAHGVTWARWLLPLAFLVTMGSALLACGLKRRNFVLMLLLGLASIALSGAGQAVGHGLSHAGGDALRFLFLLLVTGTIFLDVLKNRQVAMNAVFGACCVYLLMGLTWSSFYSVLEWAYPGSFKLDPASVTTTGADWGSVNSQLTYFSLVTLATVGYGDIIPESRPARVLSALEGLIGQLFLAVIIARLVALEIVDRLQRRR